VADQPNKITAGRSARQEANAPRCFCPTGSHVGGIKSSSRSNGAQYRREITGGARVFATVAGAEKRGPSCPPPAAGGSDLLDRRRPTLPRFKGKFLHITPRLHSYFLFIDSFDIAVVCASIWSILVVDLVFRSVLCVRGVLCFILLDGFACCGPRTIRTKSPIHAWMGRLIVRLRSELENGAGPCVCKAEAPEMADAALASLFWALRHVCGRSILFFPAHTSPPPPPPSPPFADQSIHTP
jgi:hypothetical protein